METIDMINALIESAEWWADGTRIVQKPEAAIALASIAEVAHGIWWSAEQTLVKNSDFAARANFCLLIASALESST